MWAEVDGERKKVAWYVVSSSSVLVPRHSSLVLQVKHHKHIALPFWCHPESPLNSSMLECLAVIAGRYPPTIPAYLEDETTHEDAFQHCHTIANTAIVAHVFEDIVPRNVTTETASWSRFGNPDGH
jgi:hypothetical protein